MKSDTTPALLPTADAERGEVLLTLAGHPVKVRFGLKFLKALTDRDGAAGPGDVLERLQNAPLATLLDIAELGIRLSKDAAALPADFDLLEAIEELPRAEQKNLFQVLMHSVTRNPLMEVLTQANPS